MCLFSNISIDVVIGIDFSRCIIQMIDIIVYQMNDLFWWKFVVNSRMKEVIYMIIQIFDIIREREISS